MTIHGTGLRTFLALGAMAGAALFSVAAQAADKPFYEGKTITLISAIGAGSGSDLDCRMMANYLSKYIPGNPTIIVKNMPGADAMIGDNYVGKEAKKDGLTAACGGWGANSQFTHNPALLVDFTKFDVISGHGDSHIIYMRPDVAPGIKTPEDLFKVKPQDLIIGGFGVSALKDIVARAYMATLGIDGYQYVTGFDGEGAGRAALQQKFINVWLEGMTSYVQVTQSSMAQSGQVIPIVQSGTFDDSGKRIRDPRTPNVPTYGELYQEHFGKAPSGPAWQVLDAVVGNINAALEWMALPPDSPPEAVAAMRSAIEPMDHDPGFIADTAKTRGVGHLEEPGPVVEAAIHRFLNMPPDVVAFYNQLVASGTALAKRK